MTITALTATATLRPTNVAEAAPRPAATGTAFAETLATAGELAPAETPLGKGSRIGELEPLQKFESFVLRTFVDSMLPKENASFFGEGTAGDIWRSMLAERIGDELAAAGGIGIADMLAQNKAVTGEIGAAGAALEDDGARSLAASSGIAR